MPFSSVPSALPAEVKNKALAANNDSSNTSSLLLGSIAAALVVASVGAGVGLLWWFKRRAAASSTQMTPLANVKCATPGCAQATWNNKQDGSTCCHSCLNSNGAAHEPVCEQKHTVPVPSTPPASPPGIQQHLPESKCPPDAPVDPLVSHLGEEPPPPPSPRHLPRPAIYSSSRNGPANALADPTFPPPGADLPSPPSPRHLPRPAIYSSSRNGPANALADPTFPPPGADLPSPPSPRHLPRPHIYSSNKGRANAPARPAAPPLGTDLPSLPSSSHLPRPWRADRSIHSAAKNATHEVFARGTSCGTAISAQTQLPARTSTADETWELPPGYVEVASRCGDAQSLHARTHARTHRCRTVSSSPMARGTCPPHAYTRTSEPTYRTGSLVLGRGEVSSILALSQHRRRHFEAIILSTGMPVPAQLACRRRCRERAASGVV